ncbi:hypothetical protein PYCCODRAFT_1436793 [Trametes coccinea BRFM310]|uniref:Septin-type G domain-containing protein n=1 Tax=Trametes coccinea (strain BRFM310) TaxID=1353009 RepID=A0A1Y2ILD6_TRAC3|nr:hypothetical protein PYCCODRAFT_1436793 [Trametes coccinea BRFM310]
MEEHEPSTSASTIRGLHHLDMALLPDRMHEEDEVHLDMAYRPHSRNSAYQSEPGSPSGDSISSFPSVSSSFLFSSGPASPPHLHPHSEPESDLGDSTSGLVIPSLTLPLPSRNPTPYGQTLGELRLLVLGPRGVDTSAIASQLVDDNEDVVEVGIWEEESRVGGSSRGRRKAVLHASTHWVEHRDAHGLERIEPARNVEIVELPPFDTHSQVDSVVQRILPVIHSPFREVMDILNHEQPPSGTVAHILSSSSSPLYTALILLASPSFSTMEKALIDALSPHIPIIVLPSPFTAPTAGYGHPSNLSYRIFSPHTSGFRPATLEALRKGLFRSPNTLATLRAEAASRFLRWREVERAVERVQWGVSSSSSTAHPLATKTTQSEGHATGEKRGWWDKEAWEAEWEGNLSQEVALHVRRRRAGTARRITPLHATERQTSYFRAVGVSPDASVAALDTAMPRDADAGEGGLLSPPCPSAAAFDPLHLPSLMVFSFSLLGALRTRVGRAFGLSGVTVPSRDRSGTIGASQARVQEPSKAGARSVGFTFGIGLALVGAFCAGVGFGLFAATRF